MVRKELNMNYATGQRTVVVAAVSELLDNIEDGFFKGTWGDTMRALNKLVPPMSKRYFPDTNRGLSYILGQATDKLAALDIIVTKIHSGNRMVMFEKEHKETTTKSKGMKISMKEKITRYIEATDTTDYILPAIQLAKYKNRMVMPSSLRSYPRAIHIGIDKGSGVAATLCGQHHKRNNTDEWYTLDDVEEYPNITCGSCLRVMKRLISSSGARPYMVIINTVGQKIRNAKFHVKKNIEPKPRELNDLGPVPDALKELLDKINLPYPRYTSWGITMAACRDYFGSMNGHVHAATTDTYGNITSVCGMGSNLGLISEEELNTYPDITCPFCAKITRKRFPENGPFRDKTLKQRTEMVEEKRLQMVNLFNAYEQAKMEYDMLKTSIIHIIK